MPAEGARSNAVDSAEAKLLRATVDRVDQGVRLASQFVMQSKIDSSPNDAPSCREDASSAEQGKRRWCSRCGKAIEARVVPCL